MFPLLPVLQGNIQTSNFAHKFRSWFPYQSELIFRFRYFRDRHLLIPRHVIISGFLLHCESHNKTKTTEYASENFDNI